MSYPGAPTSNEGTMNEGIGGVGGGGGKFIFAEQELIKLGMVMGDWRGMV